MDGRGRTRASSHRNATDEDDEDGNAVFLAPLLTYFSCMFMYSFPPAIAIASRGDEKGQRERANLFSGFRLFVRCFTATIWHAQQQRRNVVVVREGGGEGGKEGEGGRGRTELVEE